MTLHSHMARSGFKTWLALLAPGLFVFLWSTGFVGAKYGLPYAAPLSFLLVRFLAVAGLMLLLAWFTRAPWPENWRLWLRIGITGLFVHATFLGGIYISISNGLPLGATSIIVALQPVLTALGSAALLSERITGRQWLGLALGLLGVVVVVSGRWIDGFGLVGLPAAFGALFGITVGTLYQKRFCPKFDYRTGAVIQFALAALFTGGTMSFHENFRIEWNVSFLLALGWLTIVLSFCAIGLLNFLISTGSVVNVARLFYLVPPSTAFVAWLVFDESISIFVFVGMTLAAGGVYLSRSETLKR